MHNEIHPQAGQTVTVTTKGHHQFGDGPHQFVVEDWWDHLTGGSWGMAQGNPTAMIYAMRSGLAAHLPIDDEVVYGHIGSIGVLVHASEFAEQEEDDG